MPDLTPSKAPPEAALAFLCHGPLQAWGTSSRFPRRDTLAHPTKSGILGLVAAATGIDKFAENEAERLTPLVDLRLSTYAVPRKNHYKKDLPVTRLQDFHTIGGGFHKTHPVERSHIPRKASGGLSANAVITRRDYLTDACFLIILEGQEETLRNAKTALLNPRWGLWLGRKSCLPSLPLSPAVSSTPQHAATGILEKLGYQKETPLTQFDHTEEKESSLSYFQTDHPTAYAPRTYQSRPLTRTPGIPAKKEDFDMMPLK